MAADADAHRDRHPFADRDSGAVAHCHSDRGSFANTEPDGDPAAGAFPYGHAARRCGERPHPDADERVANSDSDANSDPYAHAHEGADSEPDHGDPHHFERPEPPGRGLHTESGAEPDALPDADVGANQGAVHASRDGKPGGFQDQPDPLRAESAERADAAKHHLQADRDDADTDGRELNHPVR